MSRTTRQDSRLVRGPILGSDFLSTNNSTEAIQIESNFTGPIDLLLSDVMMPDMSGPEVAHLLEKHRPEMRVMLMSGFPEGELLLLNYGWQFISKPFLSAKLVEG